MTIDQRQALIGAALNVQKRAHAPYSHFLVGAGLLTESGNIFAGCNVENASYGLTMCAERVAIGSAIAAGETEFVAMAIATCGGHAPCGACRQVLAEFAAGLLILLVDVENPKNVQETDLQKLLPNRFALLG